MLMIGSVVVVVAGRAVGSPNGGVSSPSGHRVICSFCRRVWGVMFSTDPAFWGPLPAVLVLAKGQPVCRFGVARVGAHFFKGALAVEEGDGQDSDCLHFAGELLRGFSPPVASGG